MVIEVVVETVVEGSGTNEVNGMDGIVVIYAVEKGIIRDIVR